MDDPEGSRETIFKTESIIRFWLVAGSLSDLSTLDFSRLNVRLIKIGTSDFDKFIDQITHAKFGERNRKFLEEFGKENVQKEHLHLLVPIALSKPIEKPWMVEMILKVMFPSDVKQYLEMTCQLFDDRYVYCGIGYAESPFHYSGESITDNFLKFDPSALSDINDFINLFIDRYESLKFLRTTISSYVSSFSEVYTRMAYLGLCISLESIVNGTSELVYRIRRNAALICGDSNDERRTIFKNVAKVYALRSKIVHGDDYDREKTEEYLPYLQKLISHMIIELLSINFSSKDNLNESLTEAGFDTAKSSYSGYRSFNFNLTTRATIVTILA